MKIVLQIIIALVFQLLILIHLPQFVFAEETGFRFPTTCFTDGSSCENMREQDTNYNSWTNAYMEIIRVTFTDFGVPENAIIDDIQIKLRIRTSTPGWTWFTWFSDGTAYYAPLSCTFSPDSCRYNTSIRFNSISSVTLTWLNTNARKTVTGAMINNPSFLLQLWQSAGIKSTDIDTLLFNIRYHIFSPTPTPTPTPIPAPAPFLDLPWDYESKGLSFNEAALAMSSYFDHDYPLLSGGLPEPSDSIATIINFKGLPRIDKPYSSHDGYDYAKLASVNIGDPVLAAAGGCALFMQITNADDSKNPNNVIKIDHGNRYQTRYLHLKYDEYLITKSTTNCMPVTKGQRIGTVWYSGRVIPTGPDGAHIHFMVVHDKNQDGSFDDNIPDGVTDPFGWQSKDPDPWETYSFFYNGAQRTGDKSYYLWKKKLDNLDANLTSNGGVFNAGKYSVNFPQEATDENLSLNLKSSPVTDALGNLSSIGSTIVITASDSLGNLVTSFEKLFTLSIDFSSFDLIRYKTDTISIYSSPDGENWTKEPTFVNYGTKTASAQLNHLTYFALMAERTDTTPSTTTAILNGNQGQSSWFKSDVQISLNAQDDEGGLGIDYTLYKIDNGEWQQYISPLNFTDEGHYKIQFFSADGDGNIEDVKTVEFDIDKTPPEVSINTNPKVLWPPNGKMANATVTGNSSDDHLFSTDISVEDEYDQIEPTVIDFDQTIQLESKRNGGDLDGRMYIIKVNAEDLAGNKNSNQVEVIVPHDQDSKK